MDFFVKVIGVDIPENQIDVTVSSRILADIELVNDCA